VAERGITGGKLQRHSEVTLIKTIEYLQVTEAALKTFLGDFYE
jgi:hypothetical protein